MTKKKRVWWYVLAVFAFGAIIAPLAAILMQSALSVAGWTTLYSWHWGATVTGFAVFWWINEKFPDMLDAWFPSPEETSKEVKTP